jgi:hypothetical protein
MAIASYSGSEWSVFESRHDVRNAVCTYYKARHFKSNANEMQYKYIFNILKGQVEIREPTQSFV